MSDAAPGRLVAARYRLRRLIARGGMGQVWEGYDERLERPVAVKVLTESDDRLEAGRRLTLEAQLAARPSDPHVVSVFDAGIDDDQPFVVTELLGGDTLHDRLQEGPLDEPELRRLATDVLGALDAAHRAGVLHRDIKPSNILAAGEEWGEGWKVGDFGIATSVDQPTGLTAVGLVLGTVAYLAPERLAGQPATASTDVYAAGAVLFKAATGEAPTAGASVTDLRPDLSPGLAAAIDTALQPVPDRRPASAAAMAALITGAPVPTVASTASPTEAWVPAGPELVHPARPRRFRTWLATRTGRIWAVVALAALITLGLGAGAAVLAGGRGPSSPAAPDTTAVPVTATPPTQAADPPTTAVSVSIAPAPPAPAKKEHHGKGGPGGKG